MPVLEDRPDLPVAARWTALGGFLIEIGGLAVATELGSGSTPPGDLGMATLAQFLLGLLVAGAGASAFVIPWTGVQRVIGVVAGGVSVLIAAGELTWGGWLAGITILGGGLAAFANLRWSAEAGHVPRGPVGGQPRA